MTLAPIAIAELLEKWARVVDIPSGTFLNEDIAAGAKCIRDLSAALTRAESDKAEAVKAEREAILVDLKAIHKDHCSHMKSGATQAERDQAEKSSASWWTAYCLTQVVIKERSRSAVTSRALEALIGGE